jgi:hypothetical protein
MAKPLVVSWSMAAFQACTNDLDTTQSYVLAGVGDLATKMNGWFFHTFTAPSGCLLRCDAHPEEDCWRVYIRIAELTSEPNKYPETIKSPENEKFAEFWEIQKNFSRP